MSWIAIFYAVVAVLTFPVGAYNAVRAPRNEKIFAVGTLLMPLGFALLAYGYGPDFARTNFVVVETGNACLLIGAILFVLLLVRRGRAPK
jgi:dipeptide/tripeptide permease